MHLYPVSDLTSLQARTVELNDFCFDDGDRLTGRVTIDILDAHGHGHVYLERDTESRRLTPAEAQRLAATCLHSQFAAA